MIPALQPGDTIAIIAPSFGTNQQVLDQASQYLQTLGFNVSIPDNLFGDDLFCANNDAARTQHFREAIDNPNIQAIWCLRGGYGASRLMRYLVKQALPTTPKWFIGFSDATALHCFFHTVCGWPTLHAPVLSQLVSNAIDKVSENHLIEVITGRVKHFSLPITPLNEIMAPITAPLIGGNITLIQSSIGTFWQPDIRDKILLLEDINIEPYQLDRMLRHLDDTMQLDKAMAILFGTMGKDADEEATFHPTVKRFAQTLDIPIYYSDKIGHTAQNFAVPLGRNCSITIDSPQPSLTLSFV